MPRGGSVSKIKAGYTFDTRRSGKGRVVEYNDCRNVVVRFDNTGNEVVTRTGDILRGYVRDPLVLVKVGDIFNTNNYGDVVVVDYQANDDVLVKFVNTGNEMKTTTSDLKQGKLKDKYAPTIHGVGCVGDYIKASGTIYTRWYKMLSRCYNKDYQDYSRYGGKGVTVCNEWLCYANYEEWFMSNKPSDLDMELDKDLLSGMSKIYSPDTCVWLPSQINTALIYNSNKNGLTGCRYRTNKGYFEANISIRGKYKYLGCFTTDHEAHQAWRVAKEAYIKELAKESYNKGEITERVYEALLKWSPPDETKEHLNKY